MRPTSTSRPATTPSPARLWAVPLVIAGGLALAVRPAALGALGVDAPAGPEGRVRYYTIVLGLGLAVAAITVAAVHRLAPQGLRDHGWIGRPAAPARAMRWVGVREGISWHRLGLVMLGWISVALGGFLWMGFQDRLVAAVSVPLLLCAVAFAVANAFTEEIVFRLALIAPLRGVLSDRVVLALCAWIFGVIHIIGVPGGPVGVPMAAFLGWFLGRSILETRGMTWALVVHGVQDVLIFGVLLHAR